MKIALIGYGKMGKEIERIARSRGHEITCIIDMDNRQDFQSPAFRDADVAIEFTNPTSAYDNCLQAFEAGVKVVSGSTGWMEQHDHEMRHLCTEQGHTLFWSSNFSLGVAIFSAVNRYLARIMDNFPAYDVSMTETHHIHKLDAPSGTAITLAEDIIHTMDRKTSWKLAEAPLPARELACPAGVSPLPTGEGPGERLQGSTALLITSIRKGEVPGIHSIRYESEADSITITHDAKNRSGFALGAVLAAEYTATHTGFLGMSDLFPFLHE